MKKYSILTVDLNSEISDEKRIKFYEYLAGQNWIKINQLTTLWYARWADELTETQMTDITRVDIEGAASFSGVIKYDVALAHCGMPIVWKK